ncbi:MAG: type II toxin-antitoxin system RelE/ParE family toxin [Proteobacteria bacterium]|nr:type II toxin-antitoxin system RelE/ParE family toxin [Pseudomonadota bacterium]
MLRVKVTSVFSWRAARLLNEAEQTALIDFVAKNPEAGDVVGGTGGVRKVRWAMAGQGKRGGARALHLYLRHRDTVWLLDIYSKREKADLSPADIEEIHDLVTTIKRAESG